MSSPGVGPPFVARATWHAVPRPGDAGDGPKTLCAFPKLPDPATIRPRRHDAAHVGNVVIEFLADGQQSGAIVRARDDSVAAELAPEYVDLGFKEANTGIPAGSAGFSEEV